MPGKALLFQKDNGLKFVFYIDIDWTMSIVRRNWQLLALV